MLQTCYIVETATNGGEALAIVHRQRPDLVLLDITLPGVSGLHLLKEIKRLDLANAVVMLTGRDSDVLAAEAVEGGAESFVRKPFNLEHLRRLVAEIIGKPWEQGERNEGYQDPFSSAMATRAAPWGTRVPEKGALLAVLIMERPLCMTCIAERTGLETGEIQSLLARIGRTVAVSSSTDRCRACGQSTMVFGRRMCARTRFLLLPSLAMGHASGSH